MPIEVRLSGSGARSGRIVQEAFREMTAEEMDKQAKAERRKMTKAVDLIYSRSPVKTGYYIASHQFVLGRQKVGVANIRRTNADRKALPSAKFKSRAANTQGRALKLIAKVTGKRLAQGFVFEGMNDAPHAEFVETGGPGHKARYVYRRAAKELARDE